MEIKRGEIYMADLSPVCGSEQGGVRPVLVVQNDIGNKFSPTVIVVAVTSKLHKAKLPTHIELKDNVGNLEKDSILLCEQIRTIDKLRLKDRVGALDLALMKSVDKAIAISLALNFA
ncbi:MAG: type II toxin-antitoxin system PemK/MazF family toxin [Christensenellales bacterium]